MRAHYTVCLSPIDRTSIVNNARKIFTVSRLNQEVQQLLEKGFGTLWLMGEISNFSRPASGHFYFSLKDSQAQIRCAMFRGRNQFIDFQPENGHAVVVRGKLGLYAARGDFQLIVEHMEPAGTGKLQAAFEKTKQTLSAQGWFDNDAKRPLPSAPQSIGIVTSPTGAALQDVLQVLKRRYPQAPIILYPTMTQGAQAAPEIVKAIKRADRRRECDVLLLVRGGGSLEDLWGFNELSVAEAIRDCSIPLVAGVGHEVDVTIADLVSDLRAPTPSAAAELATPDSSGLKYRTREAQQSLLLAQQRRFERANRSLDSLNLRLQARHPERTLHERSQRLDELAGRLVRASRSSLAASMATVEAQTRQLRAHSPTQRLNAADAELATLRVRLSAVIDANMHSNRSRFTLAARALDAVSPLAVLERGYAVVRKDDELVASISSVVAGEKLTAELADGQIHATVDFTQPHPENG